MKVIKKEWFLIMMLVMMLLAVLVPDFGRSGGALHLDEWSKFGITIIFFLYGVKLSPQSLVKNATHWRLHLCIQLITFGLYPLLWLLSNSLLISIMPLGLALGFCYLFVLPSTVSSSVTMTSMAKGNVPGAIFNASLSNVLGIVLTPLLVQILMGVSGEGLPLLGVIMDISIMLLLPIIVGQVCRPWLIKLCERYSAWINPLDKLIILTIVLNVFSDLVYQGIWHEFSATSLITTLTLCMIILIGISYLIQWGAKRCGFSAEDEIAIVFCGTKKTLIAGVPMAKVIFGSDPRLGMILLPIMVYHPLQIFYCAFLANRYNRQQR